MSMEELAYRAGISYKQLSLVERGVNNLTISTMSCLAQAFEMKLTVLLDFDSPESGGPDSGGSADALG